MTVEAVTITDYWHELVGGALLGTDRRDPPDPPAGPLADVVADTVRPTLSGRMLAAVAACTVARRSGIQPQSAAEPLAPPDTDQRPVVPPAASRRWRQLVRAWPVLEDEWLRTVDERGWRLPPDVLVGLLRRHRGDGPRRAAVMQMAGPVGPWILDHLPELAAVGGARATRALTPAGPSAALPVSPELVPLLDAEPAAVVTALAGGLDSCTFGPPHRAVLINFVARCRPEALEPLAVALRAVESPSAGIAHLLADLAATRHAMITELAP